MGKGYKVERYSIVHSPRDKYYISYNEPPYRVVDAETGNVLDDAQGYGYRTAQKAHAAWGYRTRDRSKDKEKQQKKHIKKRMKEHPEFVHMMEWIAFEIAKGPWGPDDKFDAKFVSQMLKENGLETDFTAGELLKVWQKG